MKRPAAQLVTRVSVAVWLTAALLSGHVCLPWEHHAAVAGEARTLDLDADRHQPHPEWCTTVEPARLSDPDTNPGAAAPGAAALAGAESRLLTPRPREGEPLAPARPPLFVLHAALLI